MSKYFCVRVCVCVCIPESIKLKCVCVGWGLLVQNVQADEIYKSMWIKLFLKYSWDCVSLQGVSFLWLITVLFQYLITSSVWSNSQAAERRRLILIILLISPCESFEPHGADSFSLVFWIFYRLRKKTKMGWITALTSPRDQTVPLPHPCKEQHSHFAISNVIPEDISPFCLLVC